jgi:hypothetical protein
VLHGELADFAIVSGEHRIESHYQRVDTLLCHRGQCAGKVLRLPDAQAHHVHAERAGSIVNISRAALRNRSSACHRPGYIEKSHAGRIGSDFLHELEPLQCEVELQNRVAGQIPTRAGETRHEPASYRVPDRCHDDRNRGLACSAALHPG